MADCTDFPTPEDAKRFKNNAGSVDEFITSDSDTFVDQDGGEHITVTGIDTLAENQRDDIQQRSDTQYDDINMRAENQRDQFNATFQAQFQYARIGNISDFVGDTLNESEKLNSYQYPDDSDNWYGPVQSQAFPITIPADPTVSGSGWVLMASSNIYRGLWPDTGGIADKGDTYQTQVSGTPTGQYFTALQNTTVDPVGDDVNWREVVSNQSLGGVTSYQAASVDDMISGITASGRPVDIEMGQRWTVDDYYGGVNPNNSGVLFFKIVAAGTGTVDGGKRIDIPGGVFQAEQNLKRPYDIRSYGAIANNSTDTKPAWDALTLYIRQNFSGAEIRFEGNYFFSDTPIFYSAFIYQGGGKGNTSINLPDGKNGIQINPAPTNSVSYLDMRDFSIKANNTYPSASKETGLKLDLTASCRRLNIRDVDISGFTNGLDGKCPFYLCTFENMQITGIVPRDVNDIPNYTNDNSTGFASGFNDQAGDVRDATTVTLKNVFTGSFGIGIHNRYTAAMELINCVSERNFYGVLADKGLYGTMYQEWNKESVYARGTFEPSGVDITAINQSSSWGPVTAANISTAQASKFRSLSSARGYYEYSDITTLPVTTSTQYLTFNKLNGESITGTSTPAHRILGPYEVEVSFSQTNNPSAQGTYVFDIWVKEDDESTYRNVQRGFQKVVPDDDFIGTLQFNYKGIVRGNLSNFRVSVSRVDGEDISLLSSSTKAILRPV